MKRLDVKKEWAGVYGDKDPALISVYSDYLEEQGRGTEALGWRKYLETIYYPQKTCSIVRKAKQRFPNGKTPNSWSWYNLEYKEKGYMSSWVREDTFVLPRRIFDLLEGCEYRHLDRSMQMYVYADYITRHEAIQALVMVLGKGY